MENILPSLTNVAAERKAESLLQPYRPDVLLRTNLDLLRRVTNPRLVARAAFG
jgi:hypothetical protein